MADQNLPDPNAAPNPAPAPAPGSEPTPKPADDKPVVPTPAAPLSLDSFSDDEKKYLQSQGVTDLTSAEQIKKVINHAQSSQKTAADIKNQLDKIVRPADPVNPLTAPVTTPPASDQQPQPNATPTPPQGGLDEATAFLLTSQLATSFPLLKDDLSSGKLYTDMQAMGIPLKLANGQTNLNGLIQYSKMQQDARETAAKLAELNKPGEGAIPDANPTLPAQPAADAPMDAKMARAILLQDRNHPRAAEATKFLQANPGKR